MRITFSCTAGTIIAKVVKKAIETNEDQTIWMKSTGTNERRPISFKNGL